MNSFIWVLLLLGCSGNSCNSNWSNDGCNNHNHCGSCDCDMCGNMIQPRNNNGCGCDVCGNMIQPRNNDGCGCDMCGNMIQPRNNNGCDMCDNMIQPRNDDDCGCDRSNNRGGSSEHNHMWQNNDRISPPPVPGRVHHDEECGCN